MYRLPSTSSIVAPAPRRMNTGEPPTALKARTGLSTPPGRICWARAKSLADREVLSLRIEASGAGRRLRRPANGASAGCGHALAPRPALGQRARGLARVVGDDDV